jgi:hypothetical protein
VRAQIAKGLTRNIEVLLSQGTHTIDRPLVLGPEDSGTDRHSVTWRAADRGLTIISGGVEFSGWEEGPSGLWKAPIPPALRQRPPFRQLYYSCYWLPRTRHPNEGYLRAARVGDDRRSSFQVADGDLPALPDVRGVELVFLHDWSITRSPIRSFDPATGKLTLSEAIAPQSRWAAMDWFEKQPRYFLENAPVFLDTPREWYADWSEGFLHYHPRKGQRRERFAVIAPLTDQLLVVQGTPERPVRNLHFVGLHFRHAGWRPRNNLYWGRQACTSFMLDGKGHHEADPAALQFVFAEGCSVRKASIRQCGGSGIWLGRECRSNTIQDTTVSLVGGNGIMIGEGQTRKSSNGRPWWESAPDQCASANTVEDCGVYRCGEEMFGAVGIWVGLAAKTRITHNSVGNQPYTGISLGWMWWNPQSRPAPRVTPARENVVAYNHVANVMQKLSDGGGIYILGNQPGSVLRGNRIHSIPRNVGRAESNGMFLDQGTGSFTVEDNLIYDVNRSPFRFHKGWTNIVRNNTVRLPEGVPLVRYNDTVQARINVQNNTELRTDGELKQAIKDHGNEADLARGQR